MKLKLSTAAMATLLVGVLGQSLPAHAHSARYTGNIQMQAINPGTDSYDHIDFWQYENSGCADIKDGVMGAIFNMTAWRNHKATLKATGNNYLRPLLGAAACGAPDAYTETVIEPGVVAPRKSLTFIIPPNATYLLVSDTGTAPVGQTSYQLDIVDL